MAPFRIDRIHISYNRNLQIFDLIDFAQIMNCHQFVQNFILKSIVYVKIKIGKQGVILLKVTISYWSVREQAAFLLLMSLPNWVLQRKYS